MDWKKEIDTIERQMREIPDNELNKKIEEFTCWLQKAKPHPLNGLVLMELYLLIQEKNIRNLEFAYVTEP